MADFSSQGSITDLLGGLVSDISGLFRKEIQLAKAEAQEKIEETVNASKGLAIGGVIAIAAIGVFLSAIVSGLAALLMNFGMAERTADFVAALVVAIIAGAVAWTMISASLKAFQTNKLNMNRTTNSLARDAAMVKETLS